MDKKDLLPDASFREWRKIAQTRGLREAFLWVPGLIILVLVLVYNAQNPIIKERAIFYTWSNAAQNFVRVLEDGMDFTKERLIVEKALIAYVVNREKVDHASEISRFEEVYSQSSLNIWENFSMNYLSNEKSLVNNENFMREIIISRTPNFVDDSVIQIEYTTNDKLGGDDAGTKHWVATVTFDFVEIEVSYEKRYRNVLGLKVLAYEIASRKGTP